MYESNGNLVGKKIFRASSIFFDGGLEVNMIKAFKGFNLHKAKNN